MAARRAGDRRNARTRGPARCADRARRAGPRRTLADLPPGARVGHRIAPPPGAGPRAPPRCRGRPDAGQRRHPAAQGGRWRGRRHAAGARRPQAARPETIETAWPCSRPKTCCRRSARARWVSSAGQDDERVKALLAAASVDAATDACGAGVVSGRFWRCSTARAACPSRAWPWRTMRRRACASMP